MSDRKDTEVTNAAKQEKLKKLEAAERSIDNSFKTGKADRARITRRAQLDAAEAVAMAGIAMEADEVADEAARITVIAERSKDRENIKRARKREREARKQANADHRAATQSARQAYEAIKYSAPNKMGFMRVVQVIFAIHIVLVLLSLVVTSRNTVVYSNANILTWIMCILEGVAFWLFVNRYKVARPFVIGMGVFGLLAPTIYSFATGTFSPFESVLDSVWYIFLILYFTLSKRVRSTLVNDFSEQDGDIDTDEFEINRTGWPFIRNLICYFIVFSVLGHWMEAAMCQLIRLGLVKGEYDPTNTMLWRDWLYPFPMEGMAVVLIAVLLYPLYQWLKKRFADKVWLAYVLSFLANALTCSLIEFTSGIIINADHQLWDYSDMFLNIMGQVCLQNALAFGAAASIITWFVYPMMERYLARIPDDVMNVIAVVIFVIGGILWSLYIIDPPENHSELINYDIDESTELTDAERDLAETKVMVELTREMVRRLEDKIGGSQDMDLSLVQPQLDGIRGNLDVIENTYGLGNLDTDELTLVLNSLEETDLSFSDSDAVSDETEPKEPAAQPESEAAPAAQEAPAPAEAPASEAAPAPAEQQGDAPDQAA